MLWLAEDSSLHSQFGAVPWRIICAAVAAGVGVGVIAASAAAALACALAFVSALCYSGKRAIR